MDYGISLQFCVGGMTTDNATFLLVVWGNTHNGKASLCQCYWDGVTEISAFLLGVFLVCEYESGLLVGKAVLF